jgi:negative regulator of flagellin synthesis FlgM
VEGLKMKVYEGKGSKNIDQYIKNKVEKKRAEGTAGISSSSPKITDSVHISQTSADMAMAKEIIKDQPEVRVEKVDEVKREINSGSYKVDGKKVAEKIIKENILNELL